MFTINNLFSTGKYLTIVCFLLNSLQAQTTFSINSNVIYDGDSPDEIDWLYSNANVSGSNSPYTIIIGEGASWNIDGEEFETSELGAPVTIIIEGTSSYPSGGQLFFTGNGSKLAINGTDLILVSPSNTNGLDVFTHVGHIKIETECEEYKGNQLDDIIEAGGVTGNCDPVPAQAQQLPVEWAAFNATSQDGKVKLTWTTAMELNNDHFKIQHSQDGLYFATIGEVRGAGTTNSENTYQFVHTSPNTGMNYYRIVQVDFDGKSDMSNIAAVSMNDLESMTSIRFSANNLTVENSIDNENETTVFIFSLSGQKIGQFSMTSGQTTATFSVSNLASGTYVATVKSGSQIFSERFFRA